MTRVLLLSLFNLVLLAPLGCGSTAASRPAKSGGDFRAEPEKARGLLHRGEKLSKAGKYDEARALYTQAQRYADMQVREEIRVAVELTDDTQAKGLSEDIINAAEEDRCKAALADTLAVIRSRPTLERQLRQSTSEALYDCIYRMLREKKSFAAARRLILSKEAKAVVWPKKYKRLKKKLKAKIAKLVDKTVGESVRDEDWQDALKQARALHDEGKIGDGELGAILKVVRKGVEKRIKRWRKKVQDKPKKSSAKRLKRAKRLLAAAWHKKLPGKLPSTLKKALTELSFWEFCRVRGCKRIAAESRWTFGTAQTWGVWKLPKEQSKKSRLARSQKAAEPPTEQGQPTLKSGQKLWAMFEVGDHVLVTTKELKPGQHPVQAIHSNAVWVKGERLRKEDTALWLPPNDSVVGTRIWGPLRKGQKLYELGTVMAVANNLFEVKRLADRTTVQLPRRQAHFGVTVPGTKALGYCGEDLTKLVPVEIRKVTEPGLAAARDPLVTVSCLDSDGKKSDKTKESQLGSLRMNKSWLPKKR